MIKSPAWHLSADIYLPLPFLIFQAPSVFFRVQFFLKLRRYRSGYDRDIHQFKNLLAGYSFYPKGGWFYPRYSQVMQMCDKDLHSLKVINDRVKKDNNHELAFRIAECIKSKLNMQDAQDALDFLKTLLKDYNYYSTC